MDNSKMKLKTGDRVTYDGLEGIIALNRKTQKYSIVLISDTNKRTSGWVGLVWNDKWRKNIGSVIDTDWRKV